jgi:hypothetical protein
MSEPPASPAPLEGEPDAEAPPPPQPPVLEAPRSLTGSRASGTVPRVTPEKPRADRNREKAAMLKIDYDALHAASLVSAAEKHARLVRERAPALLENAAAVPNVAAPGD